MVIEVNVQLFQDPKNKKGEEKPMINNQILNKKSVINNQWSNFKQETSDMPNSIQWADLGLLW